MDQMKLTVPQLLHVMKSYSSAWRLKTHLTGVLNHGRETIGYFDLHQWPHDSNLTINVLLRALVRMDNIPDRLFLQMDNCWRENKNQYVIVFLAVLVYLNIFKKVQREIVGYFILHVVVGQLVQFITYIVIFYFRLKSIS